MNNFVITLNGNIRQHLTKEEFDNLLDTLDKLLQSGIQLKPQYDETTKTKKPPLEG